MMMLRKYHGKEGKVKMSDTMFPTRLAGSEEAESEGQWKLYFKLYCFLDVESMPKEGVEFAFMFEQVCFCSSCSFLYWAF